MSSSKTAIWPFNTMIHAHVEFNLAVHVDMARGELVGTWACAPVQSGGGRHFLPDGIRRAACLEDIAAALWGTAHSSLAAQQFK